LGIDEFESGGNGRQRAATGTAMKTRGAGQYPDSTVATMAYGEQNHLDGTII